MVGHIFRIDEGAIRRFDIRDADRLAEQTQ
jgi:hypothetical protein